MGKNRLRSEYAVIILLLLLSLVCLAVVSYRNFQSSLPVPLPQEFIGEYSFDGSHFQPLTSDTELSAYDGDLTLRGKFSYDLPEGSLIGYFRNHILITVYLDGEEIYNNTFFELDEDIRKIIFPSVCAREWTYIPCPPLSGDYEMTIVLHNPHSLGNKSAYMDFLETICNNNPEMYFQQKSVEAEGKPFRILGASLATASILILGAAIAAAVERRTLGGKLFKFGLLTLFVSAYIYFDAIDISFYSSPNVFNTSIRQISMMFSVLMADFFISDYIEGKAGHYAKAAVYISCFVDGLLIILSGAGFTAIFDTLPYWAITQLLLCPLLIACCLFSFRKKRADDSVFRVLSILLFAAVLADLSGIYTGRYVEGIFFKAVFLAGFVFFLAGGLKTILRDHQASIRAESLERELEDSRVSVMLSQIQPHFLYNVLGSIRGLCREDPEQAWNALGDFSGYLRGNMSALTNKNKIHFTRELQHIEAYLRLERMRMGERLNILYDIEHKDFMLPPLTVQPLVENAVKHGLFEKKEGGTLVIHSRRQNDSIIIEIRDDGVGFDPEAPLEHSEQHAHVGLANVKSRLEQMCGGQLMVESCPGAGTVVSVTVSAANEKMGGT